MTDPAVALDDVAQGFEDLPPIGVIGKTAFRAFPRLVTW
jgi:hypothetical protein